MLSIGPKMDGSPNTKYFETPETLTALEGVKLWLQKNAKKVNTLMASPNTTNHLSPLCFSTYKMNRLRTKRSPPSPSN